MRGIFISYRREDAEGQAGRLFDDLSAHFGRDAVFMDVAGIKKGWIFDASSTSTSHRAVYCWSSSASGGSA